ncbi:MAG: tetratricopeptide repeat protein [Candidatus Cloacimonetes bacterium]|nr:tetratricopeptide repeat protein [Candidatus Cloacimonadota bacterium]
MKNTQKNEGRTVLKTLKRKSRYLDSIFTNRTIITYMVIDKIISGLIAENVQPSVDIDYFDTWLNLFLSGDYKLNFNEDCTEVTCMFTVNSNPEPDDNLMDSIEFAGGEDFEQVILQSLIIKLNTLGEGRPNLEKGAEYLETAKDLEEKLKILKGVSLYLNEKFEESADLMAKDSFASNKGHINLIRTLVNIYLSLIRGDGANVIFNFSRLEMGDMDDDQFLEFKNGIFMTIGCYLEESGRGLNKLLHDKKFPEIEKFTLLCLLSADAQLMQDEKKSRKYLKQAESYSGASFQRVMILVEAYNKQGFRKDALNVISYFEEKKGLSMATTFEKAKVLITGKKIQEALDLLNNLIADGYEDNVDIVLVKGDCLFRLGKYAEGVTCLQRVLEIEPDNLSGLINLGIYYLSKTKDYRLALRLLLAAEKQGPLFPQVYEAIAEIYDELGLNKKYEEYVKKAQDQQY